MKGGEKERRRREEDGRELTSWMRKGQEWEERIWVEGEEEAGSGDGSSRPLDETGAWKSRPTRQRRKRKRTGREA